MHKLNVHFDVIIKRNNVYLLLHIWQYDMHSTVLNDLTKSIVALNFTQIWIDNGDEF